MLSRENCYVCSSKATHAIHLGAWREVCEFHFEEAIEEETDGVWSRTIENHMEVSHGQVTTRSA